MDTILNYKEDDLVLDIVEGIHDPGIFKAIVLAGGPGSGNQKLVVVEVQVQLLAFYLF